MDKRTIELMEMEAKAYLEKMIQLKEQIEYLNKEWSYYTKRHRELDLELTKLKGDI